MNGLISNEPNLNLNKLLVKQLKHILMYRNLKDQLYHNSI